MASIPAREIRLGVIGAGLMGTNRVQSLQRIPETRVGWVVDRDEGAAARLASTCQARASTQWEEVVRDPAIDAVVVAIYHDSSPLVTRHALEAGKHVLCEKPLGRNTQEALALVQQAERSQRILKTGFNYRHYPGIAKAHRLVQEKRIGELRTMRIILGHGGRPGYDREWRTDPQKGGGGALLDPGVHCIDLMRWFGGEPRLASCYRLNAFWKIPYEDNILAIFQMEHDVTVFIHSSITEWHNTFSVNLVGTDGYIRVDGRGGSYGPQQIRYAPKWWWLKSPPVEEGVEIFPDTDESFYEETREFVAAIRESREPLGSGRDGYRATAIIDRIYHATDPHEIRFP